MTRKRINQAAMTDEQWNTFTNAVKVLKAQTNHPNYDDLAMAHTHDRHHHQAHASYTFLPWHREYLLKFEDAITAIDPNVMLPYWDWMNQPQLPDKLANAAEWGVTRAMQAGDSISPNRKTDVEKAMSRTTFIEFHDRISIPHGAVHTQIGGTTPAGLPLGEMSNIERSPRDVLFWLHHAFLDKLWHEWSVNNPGKLPIDGVLPPLTDITARLLPTDVFIHTSRQVFTIADLDYEYV